MSIFNVEKIKYEGVKSTNPLSFKYYNPDEVVGGKTMREQLRFAMSYWHTLCGDGTDMFGIGTVDKSYGGLTPMEIDGSMSFQESETVIVCKKLFYQDIDPEGFVDKTIDGVCYPEKDYHRMYVGEVIACYKK